MEFRALDANSFFPGIFPSHGLKRPGVFTLQGDDKAVGKKEGFIFAASARRHLCVIRQRAFTGVDWYFSINISSKEAHFSAKTIPILLESG